MMIAKNIKNVAAILAFFTLASCSNSDQAVSPDVSPLEGGSPMAVISMASNGELSGTFCLKGWEYFRKKAGSNDKWKYWDLSDEVGWDSKTFPKSFIIKEKECLIEYFNHVFSSSYGPSRLESAWMAYCLHTHTDWEVYIRCPFNYDGSVGKFKIGPIKYRIDMENSKGIMVSHYSTMNNFDCRETGTYLLTEGQLPDTSTMLVYNSCSEFYADALSRLRTEFGSQVNVNSSFYPWASLDNPMVYFDQLEEDLKKEIHKFYYDIGTRSQ